MKHFKHPKEMVLFIVQALGGGCVVEVAKMFGTNWDIFITKGAMLVHLQRLPNRDEKGWKISGALIKQDPNSFEVSEDRDLAAVRKQWSKTVEAQRQAFDSLTLLERMGLFDWTCDVEEDETKWLEPILREYMEEAGLGKAS